MNGIRGEKKTRERHEAEVGMKDEDHEVKDEAEEAIYLQAYRWQRVGLME